MAQKTSSSGKISSNVEPDKEIDGLFDYGSITERDKAVVNEVIEFIRIPHIGFSADLDYLEEMVQRLATKIIAVTSNKEQEKKDK